MMNIYRVSFIAIFIFLSFSFLVPVSGQKNDQNISSISFTSSFFFTPALEIERNYTPALEEGDISSQTSPGFEGQITYYHLLAPNVKVGGGIIGGAHSYNIFVRLTDDMNNLELFRNFVEFTDYDLVYFGLYFGGNYSIPLNKKSNIELRGGIQGVYFISQFLGWGWTTILDNNQLKKRFNTDMHVNPQNKIFFNPRLGIAYSYRISQKISLALTFSGIFSNHYIMETDETFQIYKENKTLIGTYKKPYKQMGVGIEVVYCF